MKRNKLKNDESYWHIVKNVLLGIPHPINRFLIESIQWKGSKGFCPKCYIVFEGFFLPRLNANEPSGRFVSSVLSRDCKEPSIFRGGYASVASYKTRILYVLEDETPYLVFSGVLSFFTIIPLHVRWKTDFTYNNYIGNWFSSIKIIVFIHSRTYLFQDIYEDIILGYVLLVIHKQQSWFF